MDFEARLNMGLGELETQGHVGGADLIGSGYDLMLDTTRLRLFLRGELGAACSHARCSVCDRYVYEC